MFGHALSEADYADLGGDLLGDARIEVWYNQPWGVGGGNSRIRIRTENRIAITNIRMSAARYDFSECKVFVPNRKTGALILYRVARAAKDRGISILTGTGERAANAQGPFSWGYYTSPRMGFDAPIPAVTPARPAALATCARLSDLMTTPAGRAFWKASGDTVSNMEFDLADNSLSWQTLIAYLA